MDKDTVYNDNPAAQARLWQEQGGELLVITSYSIHYTKLYEVSLSIRPCSRRTQRPSFKSIAGRMII